MIKITKKQAKTLTSSLRKAVETLPGISINHSGAQELLARTFGFKNWSAFNATFIAEEKATSLAATVATALKPQYPLVNRGQFDFKRGCHLVTGLDFSALTGTLEEIRNCTAQVSGAERLRNGELDVQYGGETEVNWDEQRTVRDESGARLWIREDGHLISEAQCVLVPEDYEGGIDVDDREFSEPVRSALVEALLQYVKEMGTSRMALEELAASETLESEAVAAAEDVIGFGATFPERAALLTALRLL